MGLVSKLREGLYKIRIVPKPDITDKTNISKEEDSLGQKINDAIDSGKRVDLSQLLSITTLKGDRNTKYQIFEEMVADGRIGAAVELYANDTVQYNSDGKIVWAESDDSDVSKYVNNLLDDLNITENIWSYAYCLWLYGDVYLELFTNTAITKERPSLLLEPFKGSGSIRKQVQVPGAKLERYIEKVPNSAEVYDLQYKGKTCGYIRNRDQVQSNEMQGNANSNAYIYSGISSDIDILSPTKFVHICLSPNINRFPETFKLITPEPNKKTEDGYIDGSEQESSGGELSFQVKSGESILENVYGAYQTLKLKEDSVLLERITKSSITRVIQVELGDMPESQKRIKLQELKNQIEQTLKMNKQAGTLQSRAGAQPTENIIYTSTKDGKGAISSVNIGGDAEIGNIDDLNQSEDKVFGALLTPKAWLGADMDGTGLSNGGSLTELSAPYARRIKRGQVAICSGLKTLVNIFALAEGVGDRIIGNFEIKLTPIATIEDNRRDELLQNKIRNVNDILALFNDIDEVDNKTKLDMIVQWLTSYLNQQEIVDILNELLDELDKEEKASQDDSSKGDTSDFDLSSGTTDSAFPDLNVPDESPELDLGNEEPETNNEETNPRPELSNDIDLSEIEGEDLV